MTRAHHDTRHHTLPTCRLPTKKHLPQVSSLHTTTKNTAREKADIRLIHTRNSRHTLPSLHSTHLRQAMENKIKPTDISPVDLNAIWHTLDDEPAENTRIIAIFSTGYPVCWTVIDATDFHIKCHTFQVIAWAYVNELISCKIKKQIKTKIKRIKYENKKP